MTNKSVTTIRIDATLSGYRKVLRWAHQFDERQWAIENARGLGRHLAQWLVTQGEVVVDVPSTATARVRELSRGGRRKTDVIDAGAAASVAALHGDCVIVEAEDYTTICAMLEECRSNMVAQRTRVANQLHAIFRDLVPGGADVGITVASASRLLNKIRPVTEVQKFRKELAHDVVKELRSLDTSLAKITKQMEEVLVASGSQRQAIDGVGAITAVRLIGRVGHAYFNKKIVEGKSRNEAMRCLKRRLANHIWRRMIADENRRNQAPSIITQIAA